MGLGRGRAGICRVVPVAGLLGSVWLGVAACGRPNVAALTLTPRAALEAARTQTAAAQAILVPAAFLAVDPDYATARLWTLDHHLLAVFSGLNWQDPGPHTGVVAGPLADPAEALPFAFIETAADGTFVTRYANGGLSRWLLLTDTFGTAASIPGGYALVSDIPSGAQPNSSVLYLVDLRASRLPSTPRIVLQTPTGDPQAVPIALRLSNGVPVEAFYSLAASALGESVFGAPSGLYRIDLVTGETSCVVHPDLALLGISPDLTWFALAVGRATPPQVEVRRYDGSSSVIFQPVSGAREVGSAVFSPEGRSVAWATLLTSPDGVDRTLVNVASTFGGPLTSILPEDISALVGADVRMLTPVAWLDEETLLVQAQAAGQARIYRIRSDGSALELAGEGHFVSLVYR